MNKAKSQKSRVKKILASHAAFASLKMMAKHIFNMGFSLSKMKSMLCSSDGTVLGNVRETEASCMLGSYVTVQLYPQTETGFVYFY